VRLRDERVPPGLGDDSSLRSFLMILHPLTREQAPSDSGRFVSAWAAVERAQKQSAPAYWLVAQPDHAALAGDLAAAFASPEIAAVSEDVVHAISLHDAGWARFDLEAGESKAPSHELKFQPPCGPSGKPLSFFEIAPADFTRAWRESIDKAETAGALGGVLVSKHFCRLAQGFMHDRSNDPGANLVREFLSAETHRQAKLAKSIDRPRTEIERLVDLLQFCDLLSLYLCCGSREDVEFPQRLAPSPIRLRRNGGGFRLEPGVIQSGASLGVTARRYPVSKAEPNVTTLGFLLI